MNEKRFTFGVVSQNDVEIKDNGEPMNIGEVVDKLNGQQERIKELENEKVELMEDCACQYKQIQKLESENDDLRTTITKQVEAITEMKDIIYMLQGVYVIGEYSSEIEEDMVELQKAYDGTLEDFLNYFKD